MIKKQIWKYLMTLVFSFFLSGGMSFDGINSASASTAELSNQSISSTQRDESDMTWSVPIEIFRGNFSNPSIAADNDGIWHVVYHVQEVRDSCVDFYIKYFSSHSFPMTIAKSTWCDLTQTGSMLMAPKIAVDKNGSLHVIYQERYSLDGIIHLMYVKNNSGTWSIPTEIHSGWISDPSIAADNEGNWHVVYRQLEQNEDSIDYYIKYISSQSSVVTLAQNVWHESQETGEMFLAPKIAADGNGKLHVIYPTRYSHTGIYHLMYLNNISGNWSIPDELLDGWIFDPSIAADEGGNWHIVFREMLSGGEYVNYSIKYFSSLTEVKTLVSGTWNNSTETGESLLGPEIAIDGNETLHVIYPSIINNNRFTQLMYISSNCSWTLLFYLDGDNNLNNTYAPIFNQLERAANNSNVQLVALWDGANPNDSAYYQIQYDNNINQLAQYTRDKNYFPQGELNMGDPQTLIDFINWGREHFPSKHYALILSDHGSGLGGAMWDDTNNGTFLTIKNIEDALNSATSAGTNRIDVFYMDACLMAMIEDEFQFQNYIDYYVASENLQWSFNEPYFNYVSAIDTNTTPSQLAESFVSGYANVCDGHSASCTMSAVDISKLDSVVLSTNELAHALNSEMVSSAITLTATVLPFVQRFEMNGDHVIDSKDSYIDLYDFARLVKDEFQDSDIKTAAQDLMDSINQYIIIERHSSGGQWNLENSHGVSIFFPATASSFYNNENYAFASIISWSGHAGLNVHPVDNIVEWGPMLVNYFQTIQPEGFNDPNPPHLQPRLANDFLFLPLVVNK